MEKKQVRQEVMERKEPIVSPLGEKKKSSLACEQ